MEMLAINEANSPLRIANWEFNDSKFDRVLGSLGVGIVEVVVLASIGNKVN